MLFRGDLIRLSLVVNPVTPMLMRNLPYQDQPTTFDSLLSHVQRLAVALSGIHIHICSFFSIPESHHTIWLKTPILRIMTSKPIVTMMSSVKENQPMTMALVPTPLLTAPLAKSCAMIDAATEAVCCHRTETRMKIEAMKMIAKAVCDTGRDGKGLTSRSEPSESSSSCQPGKVARRRKHRKANTMATMLNRKCQLAVS